MELILTVQGPVEFFEHDGVNYIRLNGSWLTNYHGGLRSVGSDRQIDLETLYQELTK